MERQRATAESTTAAYYDRLSSWTAIARYLGYGGGRRALTVHRALVDPRAQGRPTTTRLHDLIFEIVMDEIVARPACTPNGRLRNEILDRSDDTRSTETCAPVVAPPKPARRAALRVLDAGCGLAGTMIDLATRLGGDYTGVTLSESQAQTAREAIVRHGLSSAVRVLVQDYDRPPDGPFDLILAIESIAHSPDPGRTVGGLVDRLAAGGLMIVVDDMPNSRGVATFDVVATSDLAAFKAGWRCPVLWTVDDYLGFLAARGLTLIADRDLTMDVAPRSVRSISLLERLNHILARVVPLAACRSLLGSHAGGLALERLYRRDLMTYRMLVARR